MFRAIPDAVSYTHLDVYKRQVYDLWTSRGHYFDALETRLAGAYQIRNTAIAAFGAVLLMETFPMISHKSIREGLLSASWAGRFEVPVSYTHLDVYKRQLTTNGWKTSGIGASQDSFGGDTEFLLGPAMNAVMSRFQKKIQSIAKNAVQKK